MPSIDTVKAYVETIKRRQALKKELDALITLEGQQEEEVLQWFVESGTDKISIDGKTLYPKKVCWVGVQNGDVADGIDHKGNAIAVVREIGELHLYVSATLNVRGLTALEKEMRKNKASLLTVYPQLADVLKITEGYEIGNRKT